MATLSAVLQGSMTPDQIRWEITYAWGLQCFIIWWRDYFDARAAGIASMPLVRLAKTKSLSDVM